MPAVVCLFDEQPQFVLAFGGLDDPEPDAVEQSGRVLARERAAGVLEPNGQLSV